VFHEGQVPWRSEQEDLMSDIHDDRAALFANLESAEAQPRFWDRVADDAAIGEGSMAVRLVFDRLQSAGSADPIELGASSPGA
jgi:hypothetical protein